VGQFSRGLRGRLALSLVLAAAAVGLAAADEVVKLSVPVPSREVPGPAPADLPLSTAPRLQLVWIDVVDSAPFAYPTASREASAILGDAGVESTWVLGDSTTVTTENELKVVLMSGAANGARLPERVMGGTRKGQQSRTTWIYLSNVLWALDLAGRTPSELTTLEKEEVARALGRVVAHEIVHAVAPDLPHSSRGLMSGKLGRNFLIQSKVTLQPVERSALRSGAIAFAPIDTPPGTVTLVTAKR
jgi:hypothetical protein